MTGLMVILMVTKEGEHMITIFFVVITNMLGAFVCLLFVYLYVDGERL